MRKKPTIQNLGAYNEAIFVCKSIDADFFRSVARAMTNEHCARADVFVYDDESANTVKARRELRRAYYVIFVIDTATVTSAASSNGENHPFRKIYSYVQRHNRRAIACTTFEEKERTGDLFNLTYPSCMSSFEHLQLKKLNRNDAVGTAKNLVMSLRRSFPRKRRKIMLYMAQEGISLYTKHYSIPAYRNSFKFALACALLTVLNVVFPFFMQYDGTAFVMLGGLAYVLLCVIAPIIGLGFVAKRDSDIRNDKRQMLKTQKAFARMNVEQKKVEEQRVRDSKSFGFFTSIIKFLLLFVLIFVIVLEILKVELEYLSILYAILALYYLASGVWARLNLRWLSQSKRFIEYATKRHKVLRYFYFISFIKKLITKGLPLLLIAAYIVLSIVALIHGDITISTY